MGFGNSTASIMILTNTVHLLCDADHDRDDDIHGVSIYPVALCI